MKDKIKKLTNFLMRFNFTKIDDSYSYLFEMHKIHYDAISKKSRNRFIYGNISEKIAEKMEENKDSCFLVCPVEEVENLKEHKAFRLELFKINLEDEYDEKRKNPGLYDRGNA